MKKLITTALLFGSLTSMAQAESFRFACHSIYETNAYTDSTPGNPIDVDLKDSSNVVMLHDMSAFSMVQFDAKISGETYSATVKLTNMYNGQTAVGTFAGLVTEWPESFPAVSLKVNGDFRDSDGYEVQTIATKCGTVLY